MRGGLASGSRGGLISSTSHLPSWALPCRRAFAESHCRAIEDRADIEVALRSSFLPGRDSEWLTGPDPPMCEVDADLLWDSAGVSADPAAARSGVVTFLFTDVEGSTRRWETDADGVLKALATHPSTTQLSQVGCGIGLLGPQVRGSEPSLAVGAPCEHWTSDGHSVSSSVRVGSCPRGGDAIHRSVYCLPSLTNLSARGVCGIVRCSSSHRER